jgi:hypothetical protein
LQLRGILYDSSFENKKSAVETISDAR